MSGKFHLNEGQRVSQVNVCQVLSILDHTYNMSVCDTNEVWQEKNLMVELIVQE